VRFRTFNRFAAESANFLVVVVVVVVVAVRCDASAGKKRNRPGGGRFTVRTR
jgi:hypothetical protein